MTYIDAVILNLTERFCRRFQLLTGRTNVWLAFQLTNLSIIIYFVWAGVGSLRASTTVRVFGGLFCAGLLYVLTQTLFQVPIDTYEKFSYQRVAKGFRNPRRVRDAQLRISFLFLGLCLVLGYPFVRAYVTLPLHIVLLTHSLIVLTTIVLYVLACDPLPPCASRLKEWLRGLAASRIAAPESPAATND